MNDRAVGNLEQIGQRDHAETSEYRIFGPPGTGKTTNLTRQIQRAVNRYGADRILVTSFSRAAAAELTGRDLPVGSDRVGTLHSHCWHALGGPEIAEANVDEWNRDNPHLAITPVKKHSKLDGEESVDDDSELEKSGDEALQRLNRYRGMMQPREFWPETLIDFEKRWTRYKQENGLLDFTDLIEVCHRDVWAAPKNPSVIFADEAQDLNRMQLSLVRKWGGRAEYFIIAGDDDQTIYTFTGATPEAFLDPDIPEDHKIILKQSYRVPRSVHAFAESLIRQVSRRQEKQYLPRPEEGALDRFSRDGYNRVDGEILKTALAHVDRGKSVMFLTACSYMLRSLIQVLRKQGVPFHNPYRKSNGFWNPLRVGRRGSTASRVAALLVAHPDWGEGARPWTQADVGLWAESLQSKGILRLGAKKRLAALTGNDEVTNEMFDEIFEPGALEQLLEAYEGDYRALLQWWRNHVTQDMQARSQFPAEIAARRGPPALLATPKVVVGTIHSVKGGQADVVYLFPDLSQAGDAQYRRGGGLKDSVIRVFYVGATRARERLFICQAESAMRIAI
jgi:DNA helicase-2/ATP-dependent DNA helicase PcrA